MAHGYINAKIDTKHNSVMSNLPWASLVMIDSRLD